MLRFGVITDAAPNGATLWAVTFTTEHKPECGGSQTPAVCWVLDAAALDEGDTGLPAASYREVPWPKCAAVVAATGQRCRHRAGLYGLCAVHRRRP